MLSSSRAKIHEPLVTVSPRPHGPSRRQENRETRGVKKAPPKGETVDNVWYAVRDFNRDAHGLRVQIADPPGTWLREADIEDWRQSPE